MTDRQPPSVSLIVLNWNGLQYLDGCMTSLLSQNYPRAEIIMVDNGSTDGSVEYVRNTYPSVKTVETDRNLGYAGGMNVGIAAASGDIVVLLNNDIVVEQEWLARLVGCMLSDSRIGIAGSKIYYADGKTLQHAGGYLAYPLGLPDHYGYRQPDEGQYDEIADVAYVTGAAMAIRRNLIDEIGVLDAEHYFYYEDVDICYRAREAGWRVVYVPESRLVHLESATIVRDSDAYLLCFHRGRMRFLLKHLSPEEFLEDFVPAEMGRLPTLGLERERVALRRAYKTALHMLPSVYSRRFGHNAAAFASLRSVAAALSDLHAELVRLTQP